MQMVGCALAAQLLHDRTDTCSVASVITPLRSDYGFVLQCMQEGPMTPPGVPWSCGLLTAPQGQPALCSRTSTRFLMSKHTDHSARSGCCSCYLVCACLYCLPGLHAAVVRGCLKCKIDAVLQANVVLVLSERVGWNRISRMECSLDNLVSADVLQ